MVFFTRDAISDEKLQLVQGAAWSDKKRISWLASSFSWPEPLFQTPLAQRHPTTAFQASGVHLDPSLSQCSSFTSLTLLPGVIALLSDIGTHH